MKLGVVLRPVNFGFNPLVIRDSILEIERLGYDYILVYDIVTKTEHTPPPTGEPFTILSYLAGLTRKLELAVGVLILPSRQTVLVAKQAAEVDNLSNGRLRLGVAVGWNEREYQAMGSSFSDRGKRIEEQIHVMRELWTKASVTFEGDYHSLQDVGIEPQPVQRPIPIWLGGYADSVLKRVAQIGDGWLAHITTPEEARPLIEKLHEYLEDAGRKPSDIGIGVCLDLSFSRDWGEYMETWSELGATHFDIDTSRMDLQTPQDHFDMIIRFKEDWK